MTSYITANCIIISTQCNKLGEKGQSAIQVEEVKKKSEEIPTAEAFLLRAPPTPAPEVSSLTLLQQLLFTIAPAKTVVGPCEGNDPIFTEVVESKSSVNLSAPTAAPIHYAKHYPTIPSCPPSHPSTDPK